MYLWFSTVSLNGCDIVKKLVRKQKHIVKWDQILEGFNKLKSVQEQSFRYQGCWVFFAFNLVIEKIFSFKS